MKHVVSTNLNWEKLILWGPTELMPPSPGANPACWLSNTRTSPLSNTLGPQRDLAPGLTEQQKLPLLVLSWSPTLKRVPLQSLPQLQSCATVALTAPPEWWCSRRAHGSSVCGCGADLILLWGVLFPHCPLLCWSSSFCLCPWFILLSPQQCSL